MDLPAAALEVFDRVSGLRAFTGRFNLIHLHQDAAVSVLSLTLVFWSEWEFARQTGQLFDLDAGRELTAEPELLFTTVSMNMVVRSIQWVVHGDSAGILS